MVSAVEEQDGRGSVEREGETSGAVFVFLLLNVHRAE